LCFSAIPDFDIDLSITDVPAGLSIEIPPTQEKINEINTLLGQNSVCERQGRCNLGCVPGARHTLSKKFVDALFPHAVLVTAKSITTGANITIILLTTGANITAVLVTTKPVFTTVFMTTKSTVISVVEIIIMPNSRVYIIGISWIHIISIAIA
jgi:hypothetical protein